MTTRREFVQSLPAVGTAFAVGSHLVLDDSTARAQGAAAPLAGHFHPKGKASSKFTLDVLRQARSGLPFDDTRHFEEQKKGLIAPMQDLKIMATMATLLGTWSGFGSWISETTSTAFIPRCGARV